jgi:pimeloyl-ACP methyl ester carboxylesterase
VIAVDWFGWGESERSLAVAPEYEQEVARIGRLLDALGLARVNLFGHDYGGFLGLGFAVRWPGRLRRLAILNSRAQRTFPLGSYAQFGALSLMARTPGLRSLLEMMPIHTAHVRSLGRYVANGSFSAADLERYIGWMRSRAGRRWFAHFYEHYRVAVRPELAAGCRNVTAPAAVIWGDADPFCPFATAEELARLLPRARLTRLAGADHYVMEERPAEVADALQRLLAEPA